jgi:OOP family OmpA-OmpF porin
VAACGGTTQFRDNAAFTITAPAPKPPEPEKPKPKPEPEKPKRVEVKESKIEINEKIQFAYNDSKILPASDSLLTEIADVIKANPQLTKILIEGHASSDGDDKHNLNLSDKRAKSVREALIAKGVKADVLEAKGFGETKPIASNDTAEGKEKNRRVEFTIVKQGRTLGSKETK